jgi:hypothetical protein
LRSRDPADLAHWPALLTGKPIVMEVGDAFRTIPVADSQAKLKFIEKWLDSQSRTGDATRGSQGGAAHMLGPTSG